MVNIVTMQLKIKTKLRIAFLKFSSDKSKAILRKPEMLRDQFYSIVDDYDDSLPVGRQQSVEKILAWEEAADKLLLSLSVKELRDVYTYYSDQDNYCSITALILREISTVCKQNKDLKPFLRYSLILGGPEYHDYRLGHLVGVTHRSLVANLPEAFDSCIAAKIDQKKPRLRKMSR